MIGASYFHKGDDDGPTEAIWRAVRDDQWTVGGMAEAGWFLTGYSDYNGAPMFSRTPPRPLEEKA